ncbi:MAG: outer membrane protein assembly factor BamB [Betaproteobacteria bacterium]|nr:outer membrane protein assembly factor BamB [Betaproteobacteria bacterium]
MSTFRMRSIVLAGLAASLASGCSWFGLGEKKAPLPALTANVLAPGWSAAVGKSAGNLFVPAYTYRGMYVVSADGTVQELADESGKTVLRFDAKSKLRAGVGTGENVVALANDKGDLMVFDGGGRQLWKVPVAGDVVAPPVIAQGTVLVRTSDGRLVAYNRLDGKRKWVFQRPTPPLTLRTNANLVVNRGVAYLGLPGGKLLAIEVDSGKPVWESTLSQPRGSTELERIADVAGNPVIDDARICAAVYQGRTGCVDALSGNVGWARDIGSSGGVALDAKNLYVADSDGNVHALDKATGATVWKQDKLLRRDLGTPVVVNGRVLVGDNEGLVHALSNDKGDFAGRFATDGSRIISLSALGDRAIAQTEKGSLFSIAVR